MQFAAQARLVCRLFFSQWYLEQIRRATALDRLHLGVANGEQGSQGVGRAVIRVRERHTGTSCTQARPGTSAWGTEALHRQDVAYCGEIGCVIAPQKHPPQCHASRLLAGCRALRGVTSPDAVASPSETLQPKQLVDLEFSVVLLQAQQKVKPLLAHGAFPHENPPCAARPSLVVLDRDGFGFRLLRTRILLMYLVTLQLPVSIRPTSLDEGTCVGAMTFKSRPMPLLNLHDVGAGHMCEEPQRCHGFSVAQHVNAKVQEALAPIFQLAWRVQRLDRSCAMVGSETILEKRKENSSCGTCLQQRVHRAASSSEQTECEGTVTNDQNVRRQMKLHCHGSIINRPMADKNLSSNSPEAATSMRYFHRSLIPHNLLCNAVQKEPSERLEDLPGDDHSPKRALGEELGVQRGPVLIRRRARVA